MTEQEQRSGCGAPCGGGRDAAGRELTRNAMCHVCRARKRCAVYAGAMRRGAGMVFVSVEGEACPRSRWPDERGVVRWLGVRWYGAPAPLRWRIAVEGALVALLMRLKRGYFPGCGCVCWIKDLFTAGGAEGAGDAEGKGYGQERPVGVAARGEHAADRG